MLVVRSRSVRHLDLGQRDHLRRVSFAARARSDGAHVIALVFLWIAFVVLTVVAFFGFLFTGGYPRAIFDFVMGMNRWCFRVAAYATMMTDATRRSGWTWAARSRRLSPLRATR
jgi:hypothetical protein